MTYLANLQKDDIEVNYFVRVGSRAPFLDSWSALSGYANTFYVNYTGIHPPGVITFTDTGVLVNERITLAASFEDIATATFSGNEIKALYYDQAASRLYMNNSLLSMNPTVGSFDLYAEKFFFLSTKHVGFHLKPDDSDYPDVQWQGVLRSIPFIPASANENFYGFMPAGSGSISVGNDDGYLSGVFFDGSIANCTFEIYRCVGEVLAGNCQLVFRGFARDCSFSGGDVSISYVDASSLLDASLYDNRYISTDEPNAIGAVARQILCGEVNRIVAVSRSYNATKSNLNNRNWSFGESFVIPGAAAFHPRYETTNALVGSNTTTRTYLDSLVGLAVGTWLLKTTATSAVYEVTAIGANYIDHTALSAALGTSDYFVKARAQSVSLLNRSTGAVTPMAYSDLTLNSDSGIRFATTIEATYSLADPLHSEDYVVFGNVIYSMGRVNFPSTGAPLGGLNPDTNQYDSPIQAIYELLYAAGFADNEDYYDTDSFEAAATACDIRISLATPRNNTEFSPQTYRMVLAKICESALLKVYLKNGKWKVDVVGPMGASTVQVGVDELKESFSYRKLTEELVKEVTVKYDYGEVNLLNRLTQDSNRTSVTANAVSQVNNSNNKALTKDLALVDADMAELMSKRYAYLFSAPLGYATFEMKLSKMEIDLGDIINVSPTDFNELPFSSDKKFSVVSVRESEDTIYVEMFDQSGIEENLGDWV